MSSGLYTWSQTAASNANADSTINWAEGQAPSSVNDSARATMAGIAKYRDDISGAIVTGGTSTAYTVTSYSIFDTLAHLNGQMIAFTPHTTSGATVTLNVDSLGARPLRASSAADLPAGVLVQGTPYIAMYNNSDGAFYLHGFFGNPYNIPLAGGLTFFAPTAPNSSFVFPFGQAISRTTYSSLFSLLSTTYGTGDGSTTFNLPDLRGRVPAGADNMGGSGAARLTATYFGTTGHLGDTGGAESLVINTSNLPPYTPSGAISATVPVRKLDSVATGGTHTDLTNLSLGNDANVTAGNFSGTSNFTGTAQGGTSTPIRTVQPTLVCNYIMRII